MIDRGQNSGLRICRKKNAWEDFISIERHRGGWLTSRRSRLTAARYISRTELLRSLIIINVIINFTITIIITITMMMMVMMMMIMIIRNNCRTEVLLSLNLINGMRDFSNEFLDVLNIIMKSIKIVNNPSQLQK